MKVKCLGFECSNLVDMETEHTCERCKADEKAMMADLVVITCTDCGQRGQQLDPSRTLCATCVDKDTVEGLAQAQETANNLREFGTIDRPKGDSPLAQEERANQARFDALPQAERDRLNALFLSHCEEIDAPVCWASFLSQFLPEGDDRG